MLAQHLPRHPGNQGGFAAVATGHLWGKAWIWVSVIVLVLSSVAMTAMATPYYRRVGFVARALVGGTEAVTAEQFDEVLKDSRSNSVASVPLPTSTPSTNSR